MSVTPGVPWESKGQKQVRVAAAAARKVRKVSGWNIFQREKMERGEALDPGAYKQRVNALSREWQRLSHQEKQPFTVQAEYETQLRYQAQKVPLAPKGQSAPELETQIGKRGLKRLSAMRLKQNFEAFHAHPIWSSPLQLGDGRFTALVQFVSRVGEPMFLFRHTQCSNAACSMHMNMM